MGGADLLLLVLLVGVFLFLRGVVPLYIENGRLISVARTLDRRRIEQGAFRLIRRIEGERAGRAVVIDVTRWGRLELRVAAPPRLGRLTMSNRSGLLARLRRDVRYVSSIHVQGDEAATARLAETLERALEVERCLRDCLEVAEELGCLDLHVRDGWLVAAIRKVESLEVQSLLELMARLAGSFDDLVLLNGRVRELDVSARRCPFCHDALDAETTSCGACETIHHTACWDENGGCTIFGCAATGPREREPVRAGDGPSSPRA